MQDQQIIRLFWERKEDALVHTERKYGAYLFKVSHNILADPEDSRECVNDTYLAAWNSIPPHRPANLCAYLSKITREISIDAFRRRSALKRYASEYALSLEELGDSFSRSTTPEEMLDAKMLQETVNRFVCALPEDAQRAFVGRYFFLDSLKKVARYCGMKESKLKTLLYRTRQQLRNYLIKEGFDV